MTYIIRFPWEFIRIRIAEVQKLGMHSQVRYTKSYQYCDSPENAEVTRAYEALLDPSEREVACKKYVGVCVLCMRVGNNMDMCRYDEIKKTARLASKSLRRSKH